jgi:predicted nucleotidyltransferase
VAARDPLTPMGAAMATSTVLLDPPALPSICREYRARRLDVFGSVVTGRFDPAHSDIDILVTFEDMDPTFYADAYFGLHAALEALFERHVDLLTERSIENPFLRRSVEAMRRCLYSSS